MEKIAVIETGSKQYKVSVGNVIKTEITKDKKKEGEEILFDKVLLKDDGKELSMGSPYLEKSSVKGVIKEVGRDKKVNIVKFKNKTGYNRKKGHRQPYYKIEIKEIN